MSDDMRERRELAKYLKGFTTKNELVRYQLNRAAELLLAPVEGWRPTETVPMSTTTEALEALEQIARATCEDAIDHGIVSQFVSTIRAALEDVPDLSEREANRTRPLAIELEDAASLCFNTGMERASGVLRAALGGERVEGWVSAAEPLAGGTAGLADRSMFYTCDPPSWPHRRAILLFPNGRPR